ncbi:MAG: UV DNA damage repair endonuclease UvsE, partial [Candidatus Cloacimonadales bacterium]
MRLGLVCLFRQEPIKFRQTTATHLKKSPRSQQLAKLTELALHNAESLLQAVQFCAQNGIGSFRVNSKILPLKTHPELGYDIWELPESAEIIKRFRAVGEFAQKHNIRTLFHPDQFVVLSSPRPDVVEKSLAEIEYQAQVATWINADIINVHGGGGYNDKAAALKRFAAAAQRLSGQARKLLSVENDDITYSPSELLPLCQKLQIPLVYDVHHHRCLPDELSLVPSIVLFKDGEKIKTVDNLDEFKN